MYVANGVLHCLAQFCFYFKFEYCFSQLVCDIFHEIRKNVSNEAR